MTNRDPDSAPSTSDALGFEADIRPLFRDLDRTSMLKAFDLWNVDDVRTHQDAIIEHLANGSMPCDGPWPAARIEVLRSWVATGSRP